MADAARLHVAAEVHERALAVWNDDALSRRSFEPSFSATPGPTVTWVGAPVDGENATVLKSAHVDQQRVAAARREAAILMSARAGHDLEAFCRGERDGRSHVRRILRHSDELGVMRASTTVCEYDETAYCLIALR